MMKKHIFLITFLYLFAVSVLAQKYKEMGSQIVTNYAPKEYDAFGQNWAIAQGSTGKMYFGNWGGLLEFDGNSWTLHELPDKSSVNTLAIAESGKIFVGGTSDFGYFLPDSLGKLKFHSLVNFLPKDKQEHSTVWQTFIQGEEVYFFTNNIIFIWNKEHRSINTIQSDNSFHVMFQVNDKLYVKERGIGLDILSGDSLIFVNGSEQFANEKIFVMLPFPGEEGKILIGTRSMGLFIYNGENFVRFKTEADEFLADNLIYSGGSILSDGNILLGTLQGGAVIFDNSGRVVRHYNIENGIINNNIYSSFQDYSGAIWLATDNGISRIDYQSPAVYFDSRNKFSTIPYTITRFKGIIYVGSTTGAYYLDPLTSDLHKIDNADMQCWAFLNTGDELLLGTSGGLFEIDKKKATRIKSEDGVENIISIISHSNLNPDRIFLGADDGIHTKIKVNGTWIDEARILNNVDQYISIVEDDEGTIWIGTVASGVFRIRFEKDEKGKIIITKPIIEHFDEDNELPKGQISIDRFGGTNYFFSLGSIYLFDENNKSFYADNSDRIIAIQNEFREDKAHINFQPEGSSRLWLRTNEKFAIGTLHPDGTFSWISTPFSRFADDEVYSFYQDENNVTWICTNVGILKYDFGRLKRYETDFYTHIRDVQIGQDSTIFFGEVAGNPVIPEITYLNNSIKFRYSATSYEGKDLNKFKVFLDGFDRGWSSWTTETTKEYTNLPPGEYTFNVTALNILGVEGKTGAYAFAILPPWYRTWWAYAFYALVLCFGIIIVDRTRREHVLRKERERAEFREAKLRAQTVELENKALQAENESKLKDLEHAKEIEKAYLDLKSTQAQLIHAEKMASLGELTAGIAHEIQNPLNFVNNFSEVSKELLDELKGERSKVKGERDEELEDEILTDIDQNLGKIHHHGIRASEIVKSMLQHSRTSTGEKELTDINALCDEYLRLAYHGMRAKDKSFNADFKTEFEGDFPKINVIPQDIGRVLLNLINNAFQAVSSEALAQEDNDYKPMVIVCTKLSTLEGGLRGVKITVRDNGPGIPDEIKNKIFQPFFTTKPTGQGTGLGLSLSYDIVKAHGGTIDVRSYKGGGTEFIIQLPVQGP